MLKNFNLILIIKLLFCLKLINSLLSESTNGQPFAVTPLGNVQGIYKETYLGRKYAAFLGIPYAKPPAGKHRFKEPVAFGPWPGTLNATNYPSDCVQYISEYDTTRGTEDCLYLNIFTPFISDVPPPSVFSNGSSVVVYFPSGCFMFQTCHGLDGRYLLNHNLVLVTLNYRVGPIGFFSTGDEVVPGNNGLKDQVKALEWIRDNIQYFGGDPKRVTITGSSAGGASVHYHYLSPSSSGLFASGISNGGSSFNPWAQAENLPEKAQIIANHLGCPINDSHVMIHCLRYRPADEITRAVKLFQGWNGFPFSPFGPTVEPSGSLTSFLTQKPFMALNLGNFNDLPWLVLFTKDEGTFPCIEIANRKGEMIELERHWNSYLPHLLDYNFTTNTHFNINLQIKNFYFKGKPIYHSIPEFIKMCGDRLFVSGIVQAAKLQAQKGTAPVYLQKFSYKKGQDDHMSLNKFEGVGHGDEIRYLMSSGELFNSPDDVEMIKKMTYMWYKFADSGKPIFETSYSRDFVPEILPLNEKLPDISYLNILGPTTVQIEWDNQLGQTEFWDYLSLRENEIKKKENVLKVVNNELKIEL